jgi:hypothetical protein
MWTGRRICREGRLDLDLETGYGRENHTPQEPVFADLTCPMGEVALEIASAGLPRHAV